MTPENTTRALEHIEQFGNPAWIEEEIRCLLLAIWTRPLRAADLPQTVADRILRHLALPAAAR